MLNRLFQSFNYYGPFTEGLTASRIKVAFVNDDGPRNLYVDKIIIGLVEEYETEAVTTYSTGTWSSPNGCDDGYKQSEILHCDGYFQYGAKVRIQRVTYSLAGQTIANKTSGPVLIEDFSSGQASDWTTYAGTWGTVNVNGNDAYRQSDTTVTASNSARPVPQSGAMTYEWTTTFESGGRAAGLHLFADTPNQTNHGNSYLIWQDSANIRIYESINNGLSSRAYTALSAVNGQTYQYKVTYDPDMGLITVWRDGVQVLSWTDSTPLTSGGYVALRTNSSQVLFDNIWVTADDGVITYFHTDHLGSVSALSDGNGNLVPDSTARYTPFGDWRTEPTTNPTLTDRGYTGHRHNNSPTGSGNDLGLIYMNARWYVPGVARFASADTLVPDPANPQSFNRYSYVLNSPINYTDPSGHLLCKIGQGPCRNPLPPDLNMPLGTGIGFIDWIGKGTIQLGCTVLLNGACEVQGDRLVSISDSVYTENAASAAMGMVAPIGMVSMPAANASGGFIRKFTQPLMSKLDDFMAKTRWGPTWRAMAEAAPDNMLVYQLDDDIAGAVYMTRGQHPSLLQHTGGKEALNLYAFEVITESQGQGIGTNLLKAAAQESIDLGYGGRLYGHAVDNETAQWLVNRGAQIVGEGRLFYFDEAAIQALLNP